MIVNLNFIDLKMKIVLSMACHPVMMAELLDAIYGVTIIDDDTGSSDIEDVTINKPATHGTFN